MRHGDSPHGDDGGGNLSTESVAKPDNPLPKRKQEAGAAKKSAESSGPAIELVHESERKTRAFLQHAMRTMKQALLTTTHPPADKPNVSPAQWIRRMRNQHHILARIIVHATARLQDRDSFTLQDWKAVFLGACNFLATPKAFTAPLEDAAWSGSLSDLYEGDLGIWKKLIEGPWPMGFAELIWYERYPEP